MEAKIELDAINSGSWIVRGRLYSSCVRSSMLHEIETWPIRNENEVAFQWTEMRMVRWMCDIKLKDRVPSKQLRERLRLDIISVLQQKRLRKNVNVKLVT